MAFPEDLAEKAERSLAKLGVQVKCGAVVKNVDSEGLAIEVDKQPDRITAKTVIWAGGITASPLGKILANRTKAETDKGGRVKVKPDLTVPNYPDIYVVGDLAAAVDATGKPLPGLAQVAMQGGSYAAKAISRKIKGQAELPPFQYFDKGSAGGDWTGGRSGRRFWPSYFRIGSLAGVGVHTPDIHRHIPKSCSGFHPVGNSGPDFQSRSTSHHRCCTNRLQFQ
jgi:NADPH-dependent 2,4-dienoyl-CoA reductase/sulfur reductase-like enzyme